MWEEHLPLPSTALPRNPQPKPAARREEWNRLVASYPWRCHGVPALKEKADRLLEGLLEDVLADVDVDVTGTRLLETSELVQQAWRVWHVRIMAR